MQFTGCDRPVRRSHSPENAVDDVRGNTNFKQVDLLSIPYTVSGLSLRRGRRQDRDRCSTYTTFTPYLCKHDVPDLVWSHFCYISRTYACTANPTVVVNVTNYGNQ